MPKPLENREIAMIIAFREFRDEEYFIPKQTLEMAGANITTVSTSLGGAIGKMGGEVKIDLTLDELKVGDYNAVLFIGGPGAAKYIDDPQARQIAREVADSAMVLGAICIAPAILARAGVLSGKQATVWSNIMDKSAVKILKEEGAEYHSEPVVIDGKIITADGPASAKKFAEAIIEALKKE
ncbi:MAG TPA: DJ-1/PfpI family protein [Candidatus Nealsonbacteria bacterium]|uniref:DJ-1/PfpI domain-containing protein n=1 Tax=marine sediment metagenome TaxID=412755 RepID=A0A0F9U312_9ZZZZ|nr:DJ-1/PfpI family protein [Candidatus Nealsonbacteria bacterium]HEB46591.1 DJ-1/PfpI family protein [Candidatus Nealsonbacteria bacterium]